MHGQPLLRHPMCSQQYRLAKLLGASAFMKPVEPPATSEM
jgi:hypothetical protein